MGRGESWICHKVWQSPQGVGSEKEDRPLQEVCYGAEDVSGKWNWKTERIVRYFLLDFIDDSMVIYIFQNRLL